MYGTNHVWTGAAVGALVGNPLWAIPVGLAAHALGDMTPHHDYQSRQRLWLYTDGLLSGGTVLLLAATGHWAAAVAGFCAALPDAELFLRDWGVLRRVYYPTHTGALPHRVIGLPVGFWGQTLIGLASCLVLWRTW